MKLSVVIVVTGIDASLRDCIASVNRLVERPDMELILVAPGGSLLASQLRAEFPSALAVDAPSGVSPAAARAAGRACAAGSLVAFLGERYQVRGDWAKAIFGGFEALADVVVGGVELNALASPAARSIYLWEYGHLLPPASPGELEDQKARFAPGGNACYRAEILREADLAASFWELDYHGALVARGARFRMAPAMTVDYMPPPVGAYLRDRYAISRHLTAHGVRSAFRLTASLRSLVLPPALLARSFERVFLGAGRRQDWLTSLPLFLLFALVQAAGELAGCWARRGISSGDVQ